MGHLGFGTMAINHHHHHHHHYHHHFLCIYLYTGCCSSPCFLILQPWNAHRTLNNTWWSCLIQFYVYDPHIKFDLIWFDRSSTEANRDTTNCDGLAMSCQPNIITQMERPRWIVVWPLPENRQFSVATDVSI